MKKQTSVATTATPAVTTAPKTVKKVLKPTSISRTKAIEMVKNAGGKFLNITWTKNDGQVRNLTGYHKTPPAGQKVEGAPRLKKGASLSDMGYIVLWDHFAKGYRAIDTRTISGLKLGGQFTVKK